MRWGGGGEARASRVCDLRCLASWHAQFVTLSTKSSAISSSTSSTSGSMRSPGDTCVWDTGLRQVHNASAPRYLLHSSSEMREAVRGTHKHLVDDLLDLALGQHPALVGRLGCLVLLRCRVPLLLAHALIRTSPRGGGACAHGGRPRAGAWRRSGDAAPTQPGRQVAGAAALTTSAAAPGRARECGRTPALCTKRRRHSPQPAARSPQGSSAPRAPARTPASRARCRAQKQRQTRAGTVRTRAGEARTQHLALLIPLLHLFVQPLRPGLLRPAPLRLPAAHH
jgi:hypothetical protein